MADWYLFQGPEIKHLSGPPNALPEQGFLWVDTPTQDGLDWVPEFQRLTGLTLDELHLEDLRNSHHPSHFDSGHGYSLLIIRSLTSVSLFDQENRLHIRTRPAFFLLADHLLITMRSSDSRTFEAAKNSIRSIVNQGGKHEKPSNPLGLVFKFRKPPKNAEDMQIQIVNGLIDRYLEIRPEISVQLDRWQRDLLNSRKRFRDWNALLAARNELNRLEAVAEDQTDALTDWLEHKDRKNKADQVVIVKARDTLEHLERIANLARRLGESTEAAVQLHFSATAHKTNEIVTLLTILSAIFMPLTLMTGIFGMNFEEMPLLKNPNGFWIALLAMGCFSGGLLLLIAKLRKATEVLEKTEKSTAKTIRRLRAGQKPF